MNGVLGVSPLMDDTHAKNQFGLFDASFLCDAEIRFANKNVACTRWLLASNFGVMNSMIRTFSENNNTNNNKFVYDCNSEAEFNVLISCINGNVPDIYFHDNYQHLLAAERLECVYAQKYCDATEKMCKKHRDQPIFILRNLLAIYGMFSRIPSSLKQFVRNKLIEETIQEKDLLDLIVKHSLNKDELFVDSILQELFSRKTLELRRYVSAIWPKSIGDKKEIFGNLSSDDFKRVDSSDYRHGRLKLVKLILDKYETNEAALSFINYVCSL